MKIKDLDYAAYNALIAAEISRLREQINEQAVRELASSLSGGKSCTVEHPSKVVGAGALTGCANYHVRIRFDDGSPPWLMRVPRVSGFAVGLPVSLVEYLIRSEYATLKFLETTAVPAPRAFAFGVPSNKTDHGVGVCFLLMEELRGQPWDGRGDTAKVWEGLAEILAELERHPFPKAGSLCVRTPDDQPSVSAFASDRFVCLDPYGPFETPADYYTAWAEQYLTLIADGQLYPQFPVEAYLVYRFLQENATQLSDTQNTFFLKHVDDKGDHIMVDEDLNITGIIDWQMARVVPRREAFGPSLVSADMRALCEGNISLSAEDVLLGSVLSEEIPGTNMFTKDERVRRYLWGLGLESKWVYALPLANAILRVFGVDQGWDEWKQSSLERYGNDQRLKALVDDSLRNLCQ
jgi:aminoglycoside phosphotransferase (APT) family kinase protein